MFGESGDKLSKAEYLLLCSNFSDRYSRASSKQSLSFRNFLQRFVTHVCEMVSVRVSKDNKHVVWDVL